MKITVKNYTQEQLNTINELATLTGVLNVTASILYSRGIDTAQKINDFLSPGEDKLLSPYLLNDMGVAVERISIARQNGETVVIFGDYDADGICATTLLYNALKVYGIDAITVIPERDNGYGLSEGVLNEVIENVLPDLLITVDCGVSAKEEVEYLKDLGVDVIITDHHELPTELPDTTVISCKCSPYPFDGLSGTGVAYKLAYALIGDLANRYLDLVAIATIADSMPLIGENRSLVKLGLDLIKSGNALVPVNELIAISGVKEITATSLAFSVAPRINAAGRMGDAYSALRFFLSSDKFERNELLQKLVVYNAQRQQECEDLYKSAKQKLTISGIPSGAIVLYDKTWKGGLLGIVAARLAEEYRLPTVLLAETEGGYHGSARSLGDVNVYEAISSCADLLTEFGGHAQAAGVGIKEENIIAFSERLASYVCKTYSKDAFEKTAHVDAVIDGRFTLRTAKEIALLEPFGTGNNKPLFMISASSVEAKPIKEGSVHLNVKTPYIDLMYFNGVSALSPLNSSVFKNVLFESSLLEYNGREYVKGIIKNVCYDIGASKTFNFVALRNAVKQMASGEPISGVKTLSKQEIESIIENADEHGFSTVFIATNPENINLFSKLSSFEQNPLTLTSRGGKNAVIIGADVNSLDLSEYKTVVFVDKPLALPQRFKGQTQVVSSVPSFDLSSVIPSREAFGEVFKEIVSKIKTSPETVESLAISDNFSSTIFKTVAIETFIELGFIIEKEVVFIDRTVKKELTLSKIYQKLLSEN